MRAVHLLAAAALALAGCADALSAGTEGVFDTPSTCAALDPPTAARVDGTGPGALTVSIPPYDSGAHLDVAWEHATPEGLQTVVLRHDAGAVGPVPIITCEVKQSEWLPGGWTVAYVGDGEQSATDEVSPDGAYVYAAFWLEKRTTPGPDGTPAAETFAQSDAVWSTAARPAAAAFNLNRLFYLGIILVTSAAFLVYLRIARTRSKDMFIRRMPGVDAIEDAIGRSTEMGRPVLYVTGIEDIQDIQTVASLLILGHVAELTATYDTEIKVCNTYPMTMVVAEEVVRQGYANAGRLDAHRPENVMFITSEQFAFAAAVNGMILRDRPATNIYFGRFFAESLMLSETGFLTGAVQIAGTAEFSQLPFFVAACDYTLLGEELYATSAYLTREPSLMAQLKAGDVVKLITMLMILFGALAALATGFDLAAWLMPS